LQVIRHAGEKALFYYGKGMPNVKFDEGLVTEAELDLTEFFQGQLDSQFPEHQVFGRTEETNKYTHEGKRFIWVFDALDGVANFQAGIPTWGTSLALLDNFWPVLGVFYMPITGDLFHARAGEKSFWGQEEICVSSQENIDDESLLFTSSRFHLHYQATFPGKIRDFGCTGAHICYVATGRAEGALIANESYQDLAAVRVIVEAAGGKIYRMDGSEFSLDEYLGGQKIDEYLLVGSPDTYQQIRKCLKETT
jgi:myo-inositol-1(or 4)-monophosphatase